jgi:hypothetical protein
LLPLPASSSHPASRRPAPQTPDTQAAKPGGGDEAIQRYRDAWQDVQKAVRALTHDADHDGDRDHKRTGKDAREHGKGAREHGKGVGRGGKPQA